MPDIIKAEVHAVRVLKRGVQRHAEQMRAATVGARREMAASLAKAQETIERRRSAVERAVRDAQQAHEALSRGHDERRGDNQRVLAEAEQRVRSSTHSLEQARKAGQLLEVASSELLKVIQLAEVAVSEQSSAAASILSSLDAKLGEITNGGFGASVLHAVIEFGVAAEMALAVVDVSKLAGNVSQGYLPTADHVTSISQMSAEQTQKNEQIWRESETHRHHSAGEEETIA